MEIKKFEEFVNEGNNSKLEELWGGYSGPLSERELEEAVRDLDYRIQNERMLDEYDLKTEVSKFEYADSEDYDVWIKFPNIKTNFIYMRIFRAASYMKGRITLSTGDGSRHVAKPDSYQEFVRELKQALDRLVGDGEKQKLSKSDLRRALAETGGSTVKDMLRMLKAKYYGRYDKDVAQEVARELVDEIPSY